MDEDYPEEVRAHEAIWRKLHALVVEVLREFCEQGMLKERDYFVVEDDLGWDIVETELVFSPFGHHCFRRWHQGRTQAGILAGRIARHDVLTEASILLWQKKAAPGI